MVTSTIKWQTCSIHQCKSFKYRPRLVNPLLRWLVTTQWPRVTAYTPIDAWLHPDSSLSSQSSYVWLDARAEKEVEEGDRHILVYIALSTNNLAAVAPTIGVVRAHLQHFLCASLCFIFISQRLVYANLPPCHQFIFTSSAP